MPGDSAPYRDGGPVGEVAAARVGSPFVVETKQSHGLADGERVRISTATGPALCFVKASGQSSNTFSVYKDSRMTQPAVLSGALTGDVVERLNAEDWAIVAGINYYPGFTNLNGPKRDATMFSRWLLRRGFVPDDQVLPIPSSAGPTELSKAEPTLEHLSQAFSGLARKASAMRNHHLGRRLYLFLSGHGIIATHAAIPEYQEAALLMANADEVSLGLHVGARAHAEWFRALGIFDEVILFTDCCRDREDNVPPTNPVLPAWRPLQPAGRQFYAYSTMPNSKAWEKAFGEAETVRGIFSYVLVEALNNSKLYNQDGCLLASALERHLYATVPDLNGKQDPIIEYPRNPEKPEIIFAKWFQRSKQKVRIQFSPPCPGHLADLFRGSNTGTPLGSSPADQIWDDEWDAGWLYKVAIQGTDRKAYFEITGNDEVQDVVV
jgi:hypothetical protein